MRAVAAPIRFAGSQLAEARHVCAFFNSDDEEYRVLLPFIKDGFECGDKAIHVVNPDQRHAHPQRLAAVGIDPTAAHKWTVGTSDTETYLREGRFDQDRMLEVFERLASGNAKGGFLQQVQAEFAHAARVSMLGELTASIARSRSQPAACCDADQWRNRTTVARQIRAERVESARIDAARPRRRAARLQYRRAYPSDGSRAGAATDCAGASRRYHGVDAIPAP